MQVKARTTFMTPAGLVHAGHQFEATASYARALTERSVPLIDVLDADGQLMNEPDRRQAFNAAPQHAAAADAPHAPAPISHASITAAPAAHTAPAAEEAAKPAAKPKA